MQGQAQGQGPSLQGPGPGQGLDMQGQGLARTKPSVREYVFYVFFRFQKNMTFYVFLK